MAVKPTLLVLAAGMATRYGSLKQLDQFGPNGETIIEYSIYDAIKAGFGKVIFIIRESIADEFKAVMEAKFKGTIPLEFVCQELHKLPAGFSVPENRVKPWGTAHAIWVAGPHIKGPFAVINGDDFYGYESFAIISRFLQAQTGESALVGYKLENTLSAHGAVSRGICQTDVVGYLTSVTEQLHIEATERGIISREPDGAEINLAPEQLVSMNLMGFPETILPYFETFLREFLEQSAHEPKAEFYLPGVVDKLVRAGTIRVKVLPSPEKWFGITYPADKPVAVATLRQLIDAGTYPENLNQTTSAKVL